MSAEIRRIGFLICPISSGGKCLSPNAIPHLNNWHYKSEVCNTVNRTIKQLPYLKPLQNQLNGTFW